VTASIWPLCVLLTLQAASPAEVAPGPHLRQALQNYSDALARTRWHGDDGSLSVLYHRALDLDVDLHPELVDEIKDFTARASKQQVDALAATLIGVVREEHHLVPDLQFFEGRARRFKAEESRRYFAVVRELYPSKFGAPSYRQGACVRLGDGKALDLYLKLDRAQEWVPHYRELVVADKRRILAALRDECVCGDRAKALDELKRFAKALPKDAGVAELADYAQALERGGGEVRFGCPSGG
jgi:hypothetical protein